MPISSCFAHDCFLPTLGTFKPENLSQHCRTPASITSLHIQCNNCQKPTTLGLITHFLHSQPQPSPAFPTIIPFFPHPQYSCPYNHPNILILIPYPIQSKKFLSLTFPSLNSL